MNREIELLIVFENLYPAVRECLPGYVPCGWVEVEEEVVSPYQVIFKLSHPELGDLGQIRLQKFTDDRSTLFVFDPERTRDKELQQRRKEHQRDVLSAFFSRLGNHAVWRHLGSPPPQNLLRLTTEASPAHKQLLVDNQDIPEERQRRPPVMRPYRIKRAHLFKNKKDSKPHLTQKELAREVTLDVYEIISEDLKENHPSWSEDKIYGETQRIFAEEWNRRKETFTKNDVRNDYRDMGWTWLRGRKSNS